MSISKEESYKFCPICANPLEKKSIEGKDRPVCNLCRFIFWQNPKPSVSIILAKKEKVLFLKRLHEPFKDYWVLPGGYLEYDEEPETAIRREAQEETGLLVSVEKVVQVYLIDTDPRGNSIDIVYEGTITGGELRLEEHRECKFFAPSSLPDLIAYKHREVINHWHNTKP